MSKEDYSLIDTKVWEPVQSPGLRSSRHQISYDSPKIQEVLTEAFSLMFPSIFEGEKKVKSYKLIDNNGRDIFSKAVPVKNINDIPRAEMMRLMEGWIRLRRKLQDENYPNEVTSILLNFRVPNPRQSLDRYMIYKLGDESRLLIRWGYETKEEKSVSLERAISILMDVPLGHMRSILSTTMTNTTSTVPVGPMLEAAEAREKAERDAKPSGKKGVIGIVAAALVLVGGGAVVFLNGEDKKTPPIEQHAVVNEAVALGLEPKAVAVKTEKASEEVVAPVAVQPAIEEAPTAEVIQQPSMNDMMADLNMDAAIPKQQNNNLGIDAMVPAEAPERKPKNNLLSDMVQ